MIEFQVLGIVIVIELLFAVITVIHEICLCREVVDTNVQLHGCAADSLIADDALDNLFPVFMLPCSYIVPFGLGICCWWLQ